MTKMSLNTITGAQKRELLARLLRERKDQGGPMPLSEGQRAIWVAHELARENTSMNLGEAVRVRGPLDVDALRRAVDRLVDRHPALRTTFSGAAGEPIQTVQRSLRTRLEVVVHRRRVADDIARDVRERIDRPFDLAAEAPFRATLLALADDEHLLVLALHHIVGEFWALVILMGELVEFYRSETQGRAPKLPPLEATYGEFAAQQRSYLAGRAAESDRRYWLERLGGEMSALELPTDRPRPLHPSGAGALRAFELDADTARGVKELSKSLGVTIHATLLSAFAVHLYRHSGQGDLVIGAPMTGRSEARYAGVVGYFDNPLPLRITCGGDASVRELIRSVRDEVVGAFEHQAYPFPRIVEQVRRSRGGAHAPLFNVMFVLRQSPDPALEAFAAFGMGAVDVSMDIAPGIAIEPADIDRTSSQFDLALSFAEVDGRLIGSWEYSTELFDRDTIDRFGESFAAIVRAMIGGPDARIDDLPVMSDRERERVLGDWNATAVDVEHDLLLHELFERSARRRPLAIAVVAGERRMTYDELDRRAVAVARWLQDRGAQPNELVAIYMNKSWEQIVAAIAVLKAGAAYMPVDAGLPAERAANLLARGGVRLVLTQAGAAGEFGWPSGVERLSVDAVEPAPHDLSCAGRQRDTDLAYTIFTSGSTGQPKGVMIDHRGPVNTILDVNRRLGLDAADRVLALSSLSFDLSVWDIFGTFAAGATLVVPDAERAQDPVHWVDLVEREQITVWNSVPALLKLAVEHVERRPDRRLDSLRAAMMSGDWIPVDLPDRYRRQAPGSVAISMGGATEASIWSIWYSIGEVDSSWNSIPYGKPMDNQAFYVLNRGLEPCPIGVSGGLYIGGVGVTKGYWRDPDKTRASLIEHPELGMIYRTGDLGRYLADGNIEFLGRADFQVKIRGFRVELGEVEATLAAHPDVGACIAVARTDTGSPRVVAYVTAVGASVSASELRRYAEAKLPDYMVPAAIVPLGELPLSANGKVDRKALPAPPSGRPDLDTELVAPRTERERLLAAVWAEVLGIDSVGANDNFFDLGGDSIQGIQIAVRAQEQGLAIALRDLFEHPPIAELAARAAEFVPAPAAPPASTAGRWALGPMQETMLLHSLYERDPAIYCEHVMCTLAGAIDPDVIQRGLEQLASQHEVLRTSFVWEGVVRPEQVVVPEARIPFAVVDWSELSAERVRTAVDELVAADRAEGFDLRQAPLMRVTLARLGPDRALLVLCHHHLLFDGWSLTVLLADLVACCDAAAAGESSNLECGRSFGDFVHWLGERDLARAREFWRCELDGFHSATPIGIEDRPRGLPGTRFHHGEAEAELSERDTAALAQFARGARVTMSTAVMGAWGLALQRYSGLDDVVFGVTGAGRPQDLTGFERTVGLFITTVPLRVTVSDDATVIEFVQSVQVGLARAREHEQVTLRQLEQWIDWPRIGAFEPYRSIVVFENYPTEAESTAPRAGFRLSDVHFTEQTNTPLAIYALPGERLTLRVTYDCRHFDDETVERMLDHMSAALRAFANAPRGRLGEVEIRSESERARVEAWSCNPTPLGSSETLPALLERHARCTPHAPALESGGTRLTYRELDGRASQLARLLATRGVERGGRVALLLERGPDAVAAMYAVMKLGAAYVPLDPRAPEDRLAFVAGDARLDLVLTDTQPIRSCESIAIAAHRDEIALLSREEFGSRAAPEDVAYVIYTSGSTGLPKGVLVEQASVWNYARAAAKHYDIIASDRVLQLCSLAFDASAEEIFCAAAVGATLVLRPDDMLDSIEHLVDRCRELLVSVISLPTAVWHSLASELEATGVGLPECIRTAIIGGERALAPRARSWLRCAGSHVRLFNTYGPTETTIVATVAEVRAAPEGEEIPIGRPIANARVYILGPAGRPVPQGAPGELVIGGVGVARGYLDRPALTEQKFACDPYSAHPGARLYRSGDIARFRNDGQLEFLGRRDGQVKIRGFRVEVGEVEAALRECVGVADCAAVAYRNGGDDLALAAYVVGDGGAAPDCAALRTALAARLPDYAIPAAFVSLASLPFTTNGKVDRAALPPVSVNRITAGEGTHVKPRDDVERAVAAIWGALLGIDDVSVTDEFFSAGGSSLLALHLLAGVRATLGVDVGLRDFFAAPTVEAVAALIREQTGGDELAAGRRTAV
jgi:amino acid adenylation domain-containing protein